MRAGMEKQRMRSAKSPPPPRRGRVLTVVSTRFLTRERSREGRRERNWFARSRRRHDRGHRTRWRGEEGPCRRLPWERGKASCPRRTHRPARGRTEREACAREGRSEIERGGETTTGRASATGHPFGARAHDRDNDRREPHTRLAHVQGPSRERKPRFFLSIFFCFFFLFFLLFSLSISLSLSFSLPLLFCFPPFYETSLASFSRAHATSPCLLSLSHPFRFSPLLLRLGGMIDATSCGTPRLRPGINCYRETALWGAFEFFSRILIYCFFLFFFEFKRVWKKVR